LFSTEIEVTIGHINYGGHVGNDSMLTILHEARIRFLESMGYSEKDVEGAGLILSDAAIEYKTECFRGDRLTIQVAVADPGKYGFDLCYLVTKTGTETVAARAKTGILFFDYTARRPISIPEAFRVKTALA